MDTYYIRHTEKLDINDVTWQRLWNERRIAIHFPHGLDGELPRRDNASLDLSDYHPQKGRPAMRAMTELAKTGGYVCAEYFGHPQCLLGYVRAASKVDLIEGGWGSENGYEGRKAILKSLRLQRARTVNPCDSAAILLSRPRQGTIMRWRAARNTIENIVEGRRVGASLDQLSDGQQEIMCSEFLRSARARQFDLPNLAHLVVPVGRTMRDIDICGMDGRGNLIFAQVSYLQFENCTEKLNSLGQYGGKGNTLVLFCNCGEPTQVQGVRVIPLSVVYDSFASTPTGKSWIEKATNPIRRHSN